MTQNQTGQAQPGVTDELRGAVRDAAGEVRAAGAALRDEASGLGGTIKQGLTAQAERRKNVVADRLAAVAERVQRTADELGDNEPWLGDLVARGARELEDVAGELRDRDLAGLLSSVEVFARRQPALFMGASVALGFAMTRVVTAGPREQHLSGTRAASRPYASERQEPSRTYGGATTAQSGTAGRPGEAPFVGGSNV